MIDPSPELPDDMPIADVELPPKVGEALTTAGLRAVGDVREAPDAQILRIPGLGQSSLALLRKTLGLPSSMGVRGDAVPMPLKDETRNH
jgi:DNA-directed RNA polymerase alpha subunit